MVRVNNEEKRVKSLNKNSILCCSISCSCCKYLYRLLPFPLPVYSPSLHSVLTQWGTLSILWQIKIGLWVVYLFMSSFFPQVHGLTFPGRTDGPRQAHGVFSTKMALPSARENPCQEFVSSPLFILRLFKGVEEPILVTPSHQSDWLIVSCQRTCFITIMLIISM